MKQICIAAALLCASFVSVSWGQQSTCPTYVNWSEFHTQDMRRSNPCESVLNVNNVGSLVLKWRFTVAGPVSHSSPAVTNGVLYVGSQDLNYNGYVYALNASTGAKLWSDIADHVGYVDSSPAAVANGVVYVGSQNSNVYALDAVANGVVFVGGDKVYALNASTGVLLWSYATLGTQMVSSPAVVNGVVYVASEDNNVYALNARTGTKLWSYATGNRIISSPAVANGVVYVGSDDANLYALDAQTGTKLWSYTTGIRVDSSPAVANGVVYVGSGDYNVYALDAKTGAKLWSYATGSYVDSSPAVANGVVYVGSDDGTVDAFGLP